MSSIDRLLSNIEKRDCATVQAYVTVECKNWNKALIFAALKKLDANNPKHNLARYVLKRLM